MDMALIKAIREIHRSDSLDGLKAAFVEHVPTALEAEAFGLYLLDPRLGAPGRFVGNAPEGFLREYETDLRSRDPILQFVTRERDVIDGATLLGGRAWRGHPLRAWLHHWGLQHSLQGPLVLCGRIAGTVNFARGNSCGAFTARSRWLARVICDEVGAALGRLLEREQTIEQLNLFRACFNTVPVPLVISDAAGRICELNERARSQTGHDDSQPHLSAVLHRLNDTITDLADSSAETVAVGTDNGGMLVSVRLPGFEELFLSSWQSGEEAASHPLDDLPARSRAVAELLIQGRQNKWIAWRLGISQETVKDHVKRIYHRLGISSRTQLVKLALSSRRH